MKLRRPEQYETLARVRKHQSDLKAQEVAHARTKLKNLELKREELEAYQRRVLDEAGRESDRPVALRLNAFYQFERHLGQQADAKSAEINAQQAEVETRREAFEEAVRQQRIVERLIERAGERIKEHFNRNQQRTQDEAASIQFARQKMIQRRKEWARHDG